MKKDTMKNYNMREVNGISFLVKKPAAYLPMILWLMLCIMWFVFVMLFAHASIVKQHNERIIKWEQYQAECVGHVAVSPDCYSNEPVF